MELCGWLVLAILRIVHYGANFCQHPKWGQLQLSADRCDNFFECLGIGDRNIGQHFAIELDIFHFEIVNKGAIPIFLVQRAESSVETYDPEGAQIAFAVAATLETIIERVEVGLVGDLPEPIFGHAEALGASQHFLVTGAFDGLS